MEHLPEWAVLLGNFGFPILIAIYLLTRFEKRIDNLTNAVRDVERLSSRKSEH
ncbi:YvrJ family protein [Alkalicoccobacillus murimartini]|uniref:YvrJ family protein n=1 Tax=Alkalicoccobacillus murimartini TaxID=171685 RepID=A0ABT9YIE8_9BACI|nr:YvrJ family protein [Alkalicoccobacillus murimartini]MDQ0207638.1 hypothetical protein [Alkalicoccobacillus murimartini]